MGVNGFSILPVREMSGEERSAGKDEVKRMFVKQIDMNKALELLAKGIGVAVLIPGDREGGWKCMMPSTLQDMLEGCMFFRQEPAMEVELFDEVPPRAKRE